MLNTISGGSLLPRDVIQWLDSLDLSYSVRNPKMDLSNGFTVAEILTRKYPNELSILTFYNAQAKDKKENNWQQLKKCTIYFQRYQQLFLLLLIKDMSKKKRIDIFLFPYLQTSIFKLSKQEIDSIINMQPQTAQNFIFRLYELIAGRKLNIDRRLSSTLQQPQQPMYKKSTASYVAKNRQLQRIVDLNQKQFRTKTYITKHQNHIHAQKYNTGLIEWLIEKRKSQIQKEVQRQRIQLEMKTKKLMSSDQKIEVKEIELKCFNSSTSKKVKGEYGDFLDAKGVLEFLAESCSLVFKRETVTNDLKKLGIQIREKDISNMNIIEDVFSRCDQLDPKGNTKLSAETLNKILEQFKKSSQLTLIMENISSNFIDYKKFFSLFQKPLTFYSRETQTFKLVVNLLTTIAKGLCDKFSGECAEMMFYQLFLGTLLKVAENEYKRPVIGSMILDFVRKQSQCYTTLIQNLKVHFSGDIRNLSSYLALFIDKISKQCSQIQYNLWSQFFYYGFLALNSTSPITRVNGGKIISRLFSDVITVGDEIINEKLPQLQRLITDPWWQVRAQTLIILKSILLTQYKTHSLSSSSPSSTLNDNLNMKTIQIYLSDIFKPNISHNILRIGLIELAQLLNVKQSFCQRYLQILLHVGPQIRADVLTTSVIKFGPVVYGANTYNYQLTGAPLVWNALGIAKQLNKLIKKQNLQSFDVSHLQILQACVGRHSSNSLSLNSTQWVLLFQQLKSMIFGAMLNPQLCVISLNILRQLLSIKQLHTEILVKSRGQITLLLNKVYCPSTTITTTASNLTTNVIIIKENILQLLMFLKQQEAEYTYRIVKEFAEREKGKYLESNLIAFMNELSRERRKMIFHQ